MNAALRNGLSRLLALAAAVLAIGLSAALPGWALLLGAALLAAWLAATRSGRQAWSVTWAGLATLPRRRGSALVVIAGIAGVVAVLVALLSMAQGFHSTLRKTGSDNTAIVLRAGAQTEINSAFDHDTAAQIAQEPQVMRDAAGRPIASAELLVVASLPKRDSGRDANVEIRGIEPEAWALRTGLRIIAGRRFTPGLREIIVGRNAAREFAGTALASRIELNGQPWTVVGEFDAGDAHDSELWTDTGALATTYRRGDSVTSLTVRLKSPALIDSFKAAIASDPRLKVDVATTRDYYSRQSAGLTRMIRVLGTTVAVIMALGAVFASLNTMHAAVAARKREIATLRAIGFPGGPVVVSVLIETMLLAILGGAVGAAVAWALFDRYTASTVGQNFTQVVFQFRVTPALLTSGLRWALAIGLLGGAFPAMRAARGSVADGLRRV